jgi:hypothetical protein
MIENGWIPGELPVSAHLRTLTEILNQPPTAAERRQLQREQDEQDELAGSVHDAEDGAHSQRFVARVNGHPGHSAADVLASAEAEPVRDTEALARRRAALDVLKPLGLGDVITGGQSGCVLDANLGILEPVEDRSAQSARAAMDRQYAFERSAREAGERTRVRRGGRDAAR